ncbi:MAG: class I mannose-6-phosphate isomerase [Atopobiaceae bacterium]|nr:class I mannose-6-phosphate isomerase [Atopobiaceae bacterium]
MTQALTRPTQMLRLESTFKPMIWGGGRLGHDEAGTPFGEEWIVSNRPDGMCRIAEGSHAGEFAGASLDDVLSTGAGGTQGPAGDDFPVLVKLLDTGNVGPSIQVHPSDEYAQAHGLARGKSEMWVITEADRDSYIWFGVAHDVSPYELESAIANNTVVQLLRKLPVSAGDVVYLPAGTIHGTGPNITFYEVQQNSDTTYRVYDFGRLGVDGKPRELHIKEACEVASLTPAPEPGPLGPCVPIEGGTWQLLGNCASFSAWRYEVTDIISIPLSDESFISVTVMIGDCELILGEQHETVDEGQTWFVPAQEGVLKAHGNCELLVVSA